MAMVMKNLMKRLGHNKFVVQGGDWGSIIGSIMAAIFPDNIIGYHTNMPVVDPQASTFKLIIGSFYPSMIVEKEYEHKLYPLSKMFSFLIEESGYMHLQATKPDTIGMKTLRKVLLTFYIHYSFAIINYNFKFINLLSEIEVKS